MCEKIMCSDILRLKDGRECIVHEVYDNGRAFLVEIIKETNSVIEMPIITESKVEKRLLNKQR